MWDPAKSGGSLLLCSEIPCLLWLLGSTREVGKVMADCTSCSFVVIEHTMWFPIVPLLSVPNCEHCSASLACPSKKHFFLQVRVISLDLLHKYQCIYIYIYLPAPWPHPCLSHPPFPPVLPQHMHCIYETSPEIWVSQYCLLSGIGHGVYNSLK